MQELQKDAKHNDSQRENGGLQLNDDVVAMAQRGLALDFLKQIGKALLTGKNVMRMAIPIKKDVTDTRSQVQVLIEHLLQLKPLIKAAMTQGAARRDLCIEYYFNCLRQMALD